MLEELLRWWRGITAIDAIADATGGSATASAAQPVRQPLVRRLTHSAMYMRVQRALLEDGEEWNSGEALHLSDEASRRYKIDFDQPPFAKYLYGCLPPSLCPHRRLTGVG